MEKLGYGMSYKEAEDEAEKLQQHILSEATAEDYTEADKNIGKKTEKILPFSISITGEAPKQLRKFDGNIQTITERDVPFNPHPTTWLEAWMKLAPPSAVGEELDLAREGQREFVEWFNSNLENGEDRNNIQASGFKKFIYGLAGHKLLPTQRDEADLISFFVVHEIAKDDEDAQNIIGVLQKKGIHAIKKIDGYMNYRLKKIKHENGNWVYQLEGC